MQELLPSSHLTSLIRSERRCKWRHSPVLAVVAVAVILALGTGCAGTLLNAELPIYPCPEPGEACATLLVENGMPLTSIVRNNPLVRFEVDGFSPGKKLYLRHGTTELRIRPGSHQIVHTAKLQGSAGALYDFDPVTTTINTESGKSYKITFAYRAESLWRIGYSIQYQGWPGSKLHSGHPRTC